MDSGLVTSVGTIIDFFPILDISFWTSTRSFSVLEANTKSAPASANAIAIPLPIPFPAPVTTATSSFN